MVPERTTHARTGMDRATLGRRAEDLAAQYLQAAGAQILLRNYRRRRGELDIVALHRGTLLIVEERMRSSAAFGGSAASVDARKQQRIAGAARQLLQQRRDLAQLPVRFDVVAIGPSGAASSCAADATAAPDAPLAAPPIEWIRHAFELRG